MIFIDYKDSRPIYEQLIDGIQDMIVRGVWVENDQLPSVRSLAMELSINPNTIQRAYQELERKGFIYSVQGKGSYVAANDGLLEEKKNELWSALKLLVAKAKDVGIEKEYFVCKCEEFYREGGRK